MPAGARTTRNTCSTNFKTRPNSVITRYGERFEYASPEETTALMSDLVDWYNEAEASGRYLQLKAFEIVAVAPYLGTPFKVKVNDGRIVWI